jgi:eukaryotic-like serine/threonine-protein kinase
VRARSSRRSSAASAAGHGRLELLESEPSLTIAVGMIGPRARSLERFGAGGVEVNLLSARAIDDPQTLIEISWFA